MNEFPKHIDLPRGAYAILRDPAEVPERHRRPIVAAQLCFASSKQALAAAQTFIATDGDQQVSEDARLDAAAELIGAGALTAIDDIGDRLIVALIDSWSFPQPITVDGVLDLPASAYRALREAVEPYLSELMPEFTPNPDPASPTPPSSA